MNLNDLFNQLNNEDRVIKQFAKQGNKLVHPLGNNDGGVSSAGTIDDRLLTLGHLWLYVLMEDNGYGEYLRDIIKYSIENKKALFEWELEDAVQDDIASILENYDIKLKKYLSGDFKLKDYMDIDQKSKNKDLPYLRLTRLLMLSITENAAKIYDEKKDLKVFLEEEGAVINAVYIGCMQFNPIKVGDVAPESFINLVKNNMDCYQEKHELKYYPRLEKIAPLFDEYEELLTKKWYLISDDDQVIISKFWYSIKLFKELSMSLLAVNGILSAVTTRIIFDNYWQSLYLITNNKIEEYRKFVLDRMRLHILKRDDGTDANIGELLRATENGIFDPIPVNGDYFTESAREYAIQLNIKDDYDKYYEFNSEFIHSSLTAVYSGVMTPCSNPEHDGHLTIKSGGSRLIESIPGIVYLINKHIELINSHCNTDIPQIKEDELFCSRDEWIKSVK